MELFVGLDVSQRETHICDVDCAGAVQWQGKCASTPDAVAHAISKHAAGVVRIGFESGALSTWFWHALRGMGLPVVCLDARHARAALSMQVNKTDTNAANGLAHIVRMGWYKEVHVKSMDSHVVRSVLGARAQLIGMRTEVINQIRGISKTFGVVLGMQTGRAFEVQVEKLASGDWIFDRTMQALLGALKNLSQQIEALEDEIRNHAKINPICRAQWPRPQDAYEVAPLGSPLA